MQTIVSIILILIFVGIVVSLFLTFCIYRIFDRCGATAWKSFIPFYNYYVLADAIGFPAIGMAIAFLSLSISLMTFKSLMIYGILGAILRCALKIMLWSFVCSDLGFPGWMGLVVVFAPVIGYPILAFANT